MYIYMYSPHVQLHMRKNTHDNLKITNEEKYAQDKIRHETKYTLDKITHETK